MQEQEGFCTDEDILYVYCNVYQESRYPRLKKYLEPYLKGSNSEVRVYFYCDFSNSVLPITRSLNQYNIRKIGLAESNLDILDSLEEGTVGLNVKFFYLFSVHDVRFDRWKRFVDLIARLGVQEIEFYMSQIDERVAIYFAETLLTETSCLKELLWTSQDGYDFVQRIFVKYLSQSNVRYFRMDWVQDDDIHFLSQHLVDTKLERLDLRRRNVNTIERVLSLATIIRNNRNLRSLNLSMCEIPFEFAQPLIDACLNSLNIIDLHMIGNHWTSDQLISIAKQFVIHPRMRYLHLVAFHSENLPYKREILRIKYQYQSRQTKVMVVLCSVWTLPRLRRVSNVFTKFIGSNVRLLAFTLFGIQ